MNPVHTLPTYSSKACFQRIHLSPNLKSKALCNISQRARFYGEELVSPAQPSRWRTTSCWLLVTAYSIHSQLLSMFEGHLQLQLKMCHSMVTGTDITCLLHVSQEVLGSTSFWASWHNEQSLITTFTGVLRGNLFPITAALLEEEGDCSLFCFILLIFLFHQTMNSYIRSCIGQPENCSQVIHLSCDFPSCLRVYYRIPLSYKML
jgi:hypothetical protein